MYINYFAWTVIAVCTWFGIYQFIAVINGI